MQSNLDQYLYCLPQYTILPDDQKTIIDYVVANGHWGGPNGHWGGPNESPDGDNTICRVQTRQLTHDSMLKIGTDATGSLHAIVASYRFHPELEWEWIDSPIKSVVQKIIDPLEQFYTKLTRVILLVQAPQKQFQLHRDIVNNPVKLQYPYTKAVAAYQKDINQNMALKLPLTINAGDNGQPVIQIDNQQFKYDVGNQLFIINEVDMAHGALPTDHYRGVIFIDGILNWKAISQAEKCSAIFTPISSELH
jgi:hypothetical protein